MYIAARGSLISDVTEIYTHTASSSQGGIRYFYVHFELSMIFGNWLPTSEDTNFEVKQRIIEAYNKWNKEIQTQLLPLPLYTIFFPTSDKLGCQ